MVNQSSYYRNLIQNVIDKSVSKIWDSAVMEWVIYDVEEDEQQLESCICGKESLKYLYTIRNNENGVMVYPIGSSCIKKFECSDLNEGINVKEQLFKLLHAVEENAFLTLSLEYFSRKLLGYLYQEGAFLETSYNKYDGINDYQFMLDMFNKRSRTTSQDKKATAIILNSIKPFLVNRLKDKVRNTGGVDDGVCRR
ncbi:hypothetical protein [Mycoplasma sp. P36-A1]|uniref:hypothetical protein n=1 Tax=Mycoplasma sp. P36-A1 TaxID=3252900 RepID=UPI003C2B115E